MKGVGGRERERERKREGERGRERQTTKAARLTRCTAAMGGMAVVTVCMLLTAAYFGVRTPTAGVPGPGIL